MFILLLLANCLILSSVNAAEIFRGNFSSQTDWLTQFNAGHQPPWVEGKERASIVPEAERRVLKVSYPTGKFGNDLTGAQWKTGLGAHQHLTLSYKVRFEPGFNFVKGGKLPGLVGGHRPGHPDSVVSGGYKPQGNDGWSARIMWRKGGRVVQYLYHLDQPGNYGEDLAWKLDDEFVYFTPGVWHTVKTEIELNTPGQKNGKLKSWFDGRLALERSDLRFRTVPNIAIDTLYFSTFFGGDDATWSTTKNETAYFDEFVVTN